MLVYCYKEDKNACERCTIYHHTSEHKNCPLHFHMLSQIISQKFRSNTFKKLKSLNGISFLISPTNTTILMIYIIHSTEKVVHEITSTVQ